MLSAQRHPPGQPGTPTVLSSDGHRAATRRRAPLHIRQTAASRALGDADPVIDYFDDQLIPRFGGDSNSTGLSMPDGIAHSFSHHSFGMLGDSRRHQRV